MDGTKLRTHTPKTDFTSLLIRKIKEGKLEFELICKFVGNDSYSGAYEAFIPRKRMSITIELIAGIRRAVFAKTWTQGTCETAAEAELPCDAERVYKEAVSAYKARMDALLSDSVVVSSSDLNVEQLKQELESL